MKNSGFTLIELMIVVAIIAFLAVIAMPTMTKYLAKAKRAEAYMNLNAAYTAQKLYRAEHGSYATVLRGAGGVGWEPEGYRGGGKQERYCYTYGFAQGQEGSHYFTGNLGAPSSSLSQSHAGKDSFMIIAAADIDGDGEFDILGINEWGDITILKDDLQ